MFVQVFIGITIYGLKNKCWAFFQAESLLNISFTDNYKNHGKQKFAQEKIWLHSRWYSSNQAKKRDLLEKEIRTCKYWRNKWW